MKKIEVVAAAIMSPCGTQVFLAKRDNKAHQGGLWEFPGGKKENAESPQAALYRELEEEIAIKVTASSKLIKLSHDYGDKLVELDVYRVTGFTGTPTGAEGQETRWVALGDIKNYEFPAANEAIIQALVS